MTRVDKYVNLVDKYDNLLKRVIAYDDLEMRDVSDKVRILRIVDKETGEIEADIKLPDRTFGKQRWLAMFQDGLLWLGHQNITGEQFKVFCYMCYNLDFDNFIKIQQKDIVREYNISKFQVSRAIKVLKDKEIIYEAPDYKGFYKLNPYIGHKGTKNYNNNVVEFEKAKFDKLQKEEIQTK